MRLQSRKATVPARVDPRFRGGMAGAVEIDRAGLAKALRGTVEGEVRFDTASRALYATDASNYRQPPIGVVVPKTLEDVVATHAACREFGAPLVNRGGGTSLSGETVNFGVVVDHSKHLREILEIDADEGWAHVQTGVVNEQLNEATGEYGLIFPPDPSTHRYCTIGGNLGNNSCGIHSVQAQLYGHGPRTSDNTHSLEILTYDGLRLWVGETSEEEVASIVAGGGRRGEIYAALRDLRDRYADRIRQRFPSVEELPRRVSGYNLDELLPEKRFHVARALVGTESTCVSILTAKMLLTRNTPARALLVVGFEDICMAADRVPEIMEHGPIGLEGIDHELFANEIKLDLHPSELSQMPEGRAWLMVEFGGETREEADEKARALVSDLERTEHAPAGCSIFDDPEQKAKLWQVREAGLAATAFPPDGKDHWPGWEDSAVPPERLGGYLRDLRALYRRYDYQGATYGHFGQGCIHSRISFDLRTAEGLVKFRSFMEEASDLVVSYGGSLSGEHGDGQARAELLGKQFGEEILDAFREFKRIWDPEAKMNPGKVVDPYRLDEHLKLGTSYNPWRPEVKFAYTQDGGDFAHAALRCVGVGRCRIPGGDDVMCPSYIVTKEEMHTTRGRARLLFEMLEGDVVTDGWRSGEVKEALDLCLACKGCTSDCPVDVDMPTYKAEFLHHHYAGRLRPRHAYAFGLVDQAARLAARMPSLANIVTHAPVLARAAKLVSGMSREREIPAFAPLTLQDWFAERGERNAGAPRVLLWPDTFTNHFQTEVGVAAVEALEAAGCQVVIPQGQVCCGRPLYDYGFLGLAERYLRRSLAQLGEELRRGTPIVGIEPSCVAVFKDELPKLLPHDDAARRLSGTVRHLGEFLREQGLEPPHLAGKALLWGHCHHKATGGLDPDRALLESMGLEVEEVTGGCCGLAGSWGFEADHYELSMKAGEHALLPSVREARSGTLVVANGFSCRTQVEHGARRRALHLAEVLKLARDGELAKQPAPSGARRARRAAGLGAAVAVTVGAGALALRSAR